MKEQKAKKIQKGKISLFALLMMFSLLPLIVSIGIVSVTSLYQTKSNYEKSAQDTLFVVSNTLSTYCKDNDIGVVNSSNYTDYLDALKDKNIEMAIILDGAPVATSIKNENDYRIREIPYPEDIFTNGEKYAAGYFDDSVMINEEEYYGYYIPTMDENGKVKTVAFAAEKTGDVKSAITSIAMNFVVVVVVLVICATVLVILFNRSLSKTFKNVGKKVNALSRGELSADDKFVSGIKEMGNLLAETGILQSNLLETMKQVKQVSEDLTNNIQNTTDLSDSSRERAGAINASMESLSEATLKMVENVEDIHIQMQEIENYINDITGNVEHLNDNSKNIVATNNDAKTSMNIIMQNSKKSVDAINEISSQINETNDSITQIDQAVELILSLSDQTALLSLNASIEAARAGESGKGFAVVAQEIRALSEQSASGAEMIKNIAKAITDKSRRSVELAQDVHKLIMLEQDDVLKTQEKYEELSTNIDRSVEEIQSIAGKAEALATSKTAVIEKVEDLRNISQQNEACNAEVNENVSEIIAEVQNINDNCNNMNQMAKELEKSISYFRI